MSRPQPIKACRCNGCVTAETRPHAFASRGRRPLAGNCRFALSISALALLSFTPILHILSLVCPQVVGEISMSKRPLVHVESPSPTKRTTFSNKPPGEQFSEHDVSEPHQASSNQERDKSKEGGGILNWQTLKSWWSDVTPFEWDVLIASTALKLLLFPA